MKTLVCVKERKKQKKKRKEKTRKKDVKILNFVLDVVHIKVTKLETVTEHTKTDYQTVPSVRIIMLQIKSTCIQIISYM